MIAARTSSGSIVARSYSAMIAARTSSGSIVARSYSAMIAARTSSGTIAAPSFCGPILAASFHTSPAADSRIKWRHTHKPFFFTKKTAKQADTPLTLSNKKFLEHVVHDTYSASRLRSVQTTVLKTEWSRECNCS
jgi:hypothetical protein